VTSLGDNTAAIEENKEIRIDVCGKIDLEIDAKKTKYMLVPHRQNAGHNYIKMANRPSENVT
jgi:hypothetical protein